MHDTKLLFSLKESVFCININGFLIKWEFCIFCFYKKQVPYTVHNKPIIAQNVLVKRILMVI